MSKPLDESIGIRSAALKARIFSVAAAKRRIVHCKVSASDVVRECIEAHLPEIEAQYGIASPAPLGGFDGPAPQQFSPAEKQILGDLKKKAGRKKES